ncbi:MAG: sensor domain-containing diguanylate cyclase [Burkholderiales bacterium]
MEKPRLPSDELARIETLRALNILDTPSEERFDRLTRLAKRMFGVPISLVSLVDTERQWFKSAQGLDAGETPREVSFCGHAILDDKIFLVPDAHIDPRFADNPLVVNDPSVRFYAGCPLKVLNGSRLGTLCIIDNIPRNMSGEDMQLLRDLADMVEQELAAIQLATLDELTGISNRRGFQAFARTSLHMCARLGVPASLLFFDLDKFKQINDKFGHKEGDHALKSFAELLRSELRDSDVIGRLGGDEFVALLGNTPAAKADDFLVRLRSAVAKNNLSANRGYDIGYSFGAIDCNLKASWSIEDMLAQADRAMYLSKRQKI